MYKEISLLQINTAKLEYNVKGYSEKATRVASISNKNLHNRLTQVIFFSAMPATFTPV